MSTVGARGFRWLGKATAYSVLTLWAVLSLFPLYWLFVTAFQQPSLVVQMPPRMFPSPFSLQGFEELLRFGGTVPRWFLNSVIVASTLTVSNVFWNTLVGYVLAKKGFPGRELFFWSVLALLMVPWQVTLIPLYLISLRLDFVNQFTGLIVPGMVSAFGIFLMRQFLQSLPTELMEAAKIDGCGESGVFWHVVLPLAKPGMAVLATFQFVGAWNNFMWPLIVVQSENMKTLQVGLAGLQVYQASDWTLQMACGVITAVPVIGVFFAFQRHVVRGITIGALKG